MSDASVPDGPLLIVSPHLDDAALSCAALLERPEPVTVIDVFTLVPEPDRSTEWDRRCGFAGAKEAMAAREAEESAAFAGTAHEVLAVDLLEGQYRDELRALRDERLLREALSGWLAQHDTATVVLPAGAGLTVGSSSTITARVRSVVQGQRIAHADPDHLWVRDVGLATLRDHPGVTVWLYEEIPQRWSRRADAMVGLVATWVGATAEPRVLAVDRARKAERLGAYRSQLPMVFRRGALRRLARRVPADERYWVLDVAARS